MKNIKKFLLYNKSILSLLNLYTIVKGLSNLKPFRIKLILKRILLKDETKNI